MHWFCGVVVGCGKMCWVDSQLSGTVCWLILHCVGLFSLILSCSKLCWAVQSYAVVFWCVAVCWDRMRVGLCCGVWRCVEQYWSVLGPVVFLNITHSLAVTYAMINVSRMAGAKFHWSTRKHFLNGWSQRKVIANNINLLHFIKFYMLFKMKVCICHFALIICLDSIFVSMCKQWHISFQC